MKKTYSYVNIILYNRMDKVKMVGLIFYNFHEIFNGCNYVKYFHTVSPAGKKRIYFEFTNEKDIHTFKLTYNGTNTINDKKAEMDTRCPRKFQLSTDPELLGWCNGEYPPYYDDEQGMFYIEEATKPMKLF